MTGIDESAGAQLTITKQQTASTSGIEHVKRAEGHAAASGCSYAWGERILCENTSP